MLHNHRRFIVQLLHLDSSALGAASVSRRLVPRLTDVKVVRAEGLAFGPDAKEAAVSSALEDIAAITA